MLLLSALQCAPFFAVGIILSCFVTLSLGHIYEPFLCYINHLFGPKRDEGTGEWRKLHNEELNDLYSLPNIVRVVKSRRMRWVVHVARMGEGRGMRRVLVGKPEGKKPLGRPRRRWEDNIKMDLQEVGGVVGTGRSGLGIGTGGGHLWVRYLTFGFHKCGEFLD
jgi:hypothetical protein